MSKQQVVNFGPKNEKEAIVFAEETFRVKVQHMIQKAMNQNGVSNEELAKRLNVSEDYVELIFSSNCKITIKFLARIFHVIGEECRIEF